MSLQKYEEYKAQKGVMRFDVINYFAKKYQAQTYLEVGTQNVDNNFNKICVAHKECIDPRPMKGEMTYKMTSDQAFDQIKKSKKTYDIIFIDGLHLESQVDKDIANSLQVLNPGGVIVMHDCNPPLKSCENPLENGTCWKSFAKLRTTRQDLFMCVIDADWGCGVIRRGVQTLYVPKIKNWLTYDYFDQNRVELMNLISSEKINEL